MIRLIIVVILTITSVVFTVYAPRILGNATNELFKGIISKQLPPGVTKDQVIAMLKARGQDQFAEMISNMDLVPGAGVDSEPSVNFAYPSCDLPFSCSLSMASAVHYGWRLSTYSL